MEETTPNPQEATGQQVAPQTAVPEVPATPSAAPAEMPPVQLQPTQTLTPVTEEQPPVVPPQAPSRGKKNILFIALGLLLLALLAAGGYVFVNKGFLTKEKACTQEAKVCPDGTSVGRIGPNCEFAACPTPTEAPNPTANWKTYTSQAGKFSFRYPSELFTISTDDRMLTFYLSESEAKEAANCLSNKLGTIEKPCGQFMVLNVGVSKYPTNYQYSLKNSSGSTDPDLLKPTTYMDQQNRAWLIEGPVEIPGGFNTKGEKEQEDSLYQVSIQIGDLGFNKYMNRQLVEKEAVQLNNQILSTFKFIEATPSATPTSSPSATLTP